MIASSISPTSPNLKVTTADAYLLVRFVHQGVCHCCRETTGCCGRRFNAGPGLTSISIRTMWRCWRLIEFIEGEPWVLHSRFEEPEIQSLPKLQGGLDRYLTEPVPKVFKRQWELSGLPTFARRTSRWWSLNVALSKRTRRVGTFFFTTLAGKGVEIQDPPAYFTSNLSYGPLDERNRCRVTMSYDHRLMDGSTVADCPIELEAVLNGQIAEELETMIAGAKNMITGTKNTQRKAA